MIEIKELTTIEELKALKHIEKAVWDMDPLPTHQTLTAVKNGGLVIGAYDGENLIGFSYGFAGFSGGQTYLCSHMLGIIDNYRSKKIGEKLKQKQRQVALRKGYSKMHWTFDPLETRNAYLNLSKLRGIVDVYIEDAYGAMEDGLNKGLPSDRFEVHWFLSSEHVDEYSPPTIEAASLLNKIAYNNDIPTFGERLEETLSQETYGVVVPNNIQELKQHAPDIALDWRLKTRHLFQELITAGYAAVHLYPHERTATYIFVKKESLNLGDEQ